jgi:hypothetical protein
MKAWMPVLAIGLLSACGEGDQPQQRTTKVMRAANPISDQLKGMTEIYRYLGLRRAITDSGQRCKKVDRGAYQEDYKTMAYWTAHCTDTGDWAVFIAPNANVQVRQCRHMAGLRLPACRPTEPPKPA